MALRIRGGTWHYHFKFDGKRYGKTTGLAATKRNETTAHDKEAKHRQALREGRSPRRIPVREFTEAAKAFLCGAETQSSTSEQLPADCHEFRKYQGIFRT